MPKNCTECKHYKDCHSYYGSPVCLNKNNQNLNEKYHKILENRDMTNGQIDIEYEYIESLYRKCLENNSFLCANGDDDC